MKTTRFLVTLLVAFILSFVQSCTGTRPVSGKSGSGSRAAHYASNSAQGQKRSVLSSVKQFFGFGQKPAPQIVHASDNDLKNVPSAIRVLPALPYVEATDLPADPLLVGPIDSRFGVVSEGAATTSREVRILGAGAHVITNLPPWNTSSSDTVPEKSTASPTKTTVRLEMDPADITIPKDADVGLLPTIVPPGETAVATMPESPKEVPQVEEKAAVKVEVEVDTSVKKTVVNVAQPSTTTEFVTSEPTVVVTKDAQKALRAIIDQQGNTVGYIARIRIIASGFPIGDEDGKFQIGNLGIFTGNNAISEELEDKTKRTPKRLFFRQVLSGFDAGDFTNRDAEYSELSSSLLSKVENEARVIRPPDGREISFRGGIQPILNFTGFKSVTMPAKRKEGRGEFVQVAEVLVQEHCDQVFIHCFDSPIGKDGRPVPEVLKPESVLPRITQEMLTKNRPIVFLPAEFEQARKIAAENKSQSRIGANAAFFRELDFYSPEPGSAPEVSKEEVSSHYTQPLKQTVNGYASLFPITRMSDQARFGVIGMLCILFGVIFYRSYQMAGDESVVMAGGPYPLYKPVGLPFWSRVRNMPDRKAEVKIVPPATEIGAKAGLQPPRQPFVAQIGAIDRAKRPRRSRVTSSIPRELPGIDRFGL